MPAIKLLDPHLINLINAGEVVETPASVVKELVENAIDAEATEVTVEIIAGGREQIRVIDNGVGMELDDALLSLERHATSKIRSVEDLSKIHTMGFRGEAVPSIASISRFSLLTSVGDQRFGANFIEVDAGKRVSTTRAVRDKGTTIEVNDLFYNVPVRKKFLRSPLVDQQDIQKVIVNYALAYPHIKFHLISDRKSTLKAGQVVKDSHLEMVKQRIDQVLGDPFTKEALLVDTTVGSIHIEGWIVTPKVHRPNKTGQHLFINKRPVIAPKIQEAIKEGYGSSIGEGRYPLFVLYYTLPPEEVDVNIHPQKKEVRLSHLSDVQQASYRAVQEALMGTKRTHEHSYTSIAWQPPNTWAPLEVSQPKEEHLEFDLSAPRVLTTLKGYILFEPASCPALFANDLQDESVGLIDQKMALQALYDQTGSDREPLIDKQPLLIPETIELTRHETFQIEEILPEFEKMGIEMTLFGQNTLLLECAPFGMTKKGVIDLIHHTLGDTKRSKMRVGQAIGQGVLDRKMSCQEAAAFIKRLAKRLPPKGRDHPFIQLLSVKEMARLFRK